MSEEQTWWAVFDKDGNGVYPQSYPTRYEAIVAYVGDDLYGWVVTEAQGYYAAPAKIVEVK